MGVFQTGGRTRRKSGAPSVRLECECLENRLVASVSGAPVQVNTETAGVQLYSTCARSANGMSVVVWEDWGTTTLTRHLKARLFDATPAPITDEIILVNDGTGYSGATAAMDADGDFVIAWNSDFDGTEGIDFSRFSSAGALLGTGNIPHPSTKRISVNPDIFVSATGSFVIAYEQAPIIGWNINVLASMFQADGTLVKSIKVARDQPRELAPSIAGAADGRFAIIYTKGIPQADPLKNKLFAQRYSTSGALLGKHKLVSGLDTYPNTDVAMDNSGNVLAGWQQYDHSNVDGTIDYYSLRVRSITAAGVMSPEVVIDPNLSFETVSLALAKDGSGSFVATTHAGAGFRIVEVLSAGGVYTATEVLVANTGSQAFDYGGDPIVSIDDANGYVVAVNSESGMYASDGDSWGVFTQFGELGS